MHTWFLIALLGAATPYDDVQIIAAASSPFREYRLLKRNPKIPPEAYLKAAQGQIATGISAVEGYASKIGWGIGVIPVSMRHLFASINEEQRHTAFTAVSHTSIVAGEPCSDGRMVFMILPLPVISDRWWVTHQYTNAKIRQRSKGKVAELVWQEATEWKASAEHKIAIKDAVQVRFTRGSWLLIALDDNHTLAEYHSWVDPGGSIPVGPASSFASGSIVDTFQQMETFAKSQSASQCDRMWKE